MGDTLPVADYLAVGLEAKLDELRQRQWRDGANGSSCKGAKTCLV